MDKYSSLLRTLKNYGHESFITLDPGVKLIKPISLCRAIKLECLSLESQYSQVKCVRVWPEPTLEVRTYPRVEHLKGASLG